MRFLTSRINWPLLGLVFVLVDKINGHRKLDMVSL
jgi:hypothetical protein